VKSPYPIIIIFALWLISFLGKQAYITSSVDYSDNASIQVLTTLKCWDEKSPVNYAFLPVQTFQNNGDKFITPYKRIEDSDGNNYYVSYPPFVFQLAYFFEKLTGLGSNKLMLMLLNSLLQLVSALYLFKILLMRLKEDSYGMYLSLLWVSIFLLAPVSNYNFSRMYFSETLAIPLWLASSYYFLKLIISTHESKNRFFIRNEVKFGIVLFLFVYTEWLGIIFAAILILMLLCNKEWVNRKKMIFLILISSITPLILFFIQLLYISSIHQMIQGLGIRFVERSGWFGHKYSGEGVAINNGIVFQYLVNNGIQALSLIGALLFLIIPAFYFRFYKKVKSIDRQLMMLFVLPVIIHVLIFMNANALHLHLFEKSLISIIILLMIGSKLLKLYTAKWSSIITGIVTCVLLINLFFMDILPENSEKEELFMNKIAAQVKSESTSDCAIFANIQNSKAPTQDLIYLGFILSRNIGFANSPTEAREKQIQKKSILFIDADYITKNVTAIKY
jgi:hypothetical protein